LFLEKEWDFQIRIVCFLVHSNMEKPSISVEFCSSNNIEDERSSSTSDVEENVSMPLEIIPLIDLNRGLIGWDSLTDLANPK
jgi:hypothetical protein